MDPNHCNVYLAPMDDAARPVSMKLAMQLREAGIRAEYDLANRTFKAQMKYADKLGTDYLLVLGSNELAEQKAQLKNMKTGEQRPIRLDEHFIEDYTELSLSDLLGGGSLA